MDIKIRLQSVEMSFRVIVAFLTKEYNPFVCFGPYRRNVLQNN